MGFMESYKYLDNLCKDMNGIGITGYIKDMEQELNGEFYVTGWKNDYLQLKHYRYIRNQIVHENYANESDMCSARDSDWLDEFYQRIMEQTDPLAMCYKNPKFRSSTKFIETKEVPAAQCVQPCPKLYQKERQPQIYDMLLTAVAVMLILFVILIVIIILVQLILSN